MLDQILTHLFANQWLVFAIVGLLLLVAAELGFWGGTQLHRKKDESRKSLQSGMQGAVLALLGLLLGFTFAMSAGRYDTRRTLVLQEANAIGTTYLRAAFLPESRQREVEALLRRYVDARLQFYGAGTDRAGQATAEKLAAGIQRELWTHTVAVARDNPTPVTTTFVSALNDMIDLDATRLNALRTHVPGAVWLLLLVVSAAGCALTGYGAGANGARSGLTNVLLPLLVAVVITFIADLDRPRGGLIVISQQPMLDLQQSLLPESPAVKQAGQP